jgi:hypothetical protein
LATAMFIAITAITAGSNARRIPKPVTGLVLPIEERPS